MTSFFFDHCTQSSTYTNALWMFLKAFLEVHSHVYSVERDTCILWKCILCFILLRK